MEGKSAPPCHGRLTSSDAPATKTKHPVGTACTHCWRADKRLFLKDKEARDLTVKVVRRQTGVVRPQARVSARQFPRHLQQSIQHLHRSLWFQ